MLLVIVMMVFRKSTVLPCPSVRRPSSRIWSSTCVTSACAFSISSRRTTEYGRTASSCPTTRSFNRCSIERSFWSSLSRSRCTGMPVHRATTDAMSSASTSSFRILRSFCSFASSPLSFSSSFSSPAIDP